ncbi:MAG: NAD(P)H-hydrate epimerase, partial [Candidatus Calescibacterium sp.]
MFDHKQKMGGESYLKSKLYLRNKNLILKDAKLVSRERARELDQIAEKEYGIPTLLLMENAGRMIAENILKIVSERGLKNIVIVAGKGNNGGDGFCAAKHIKNQRKEINIKIIILEDEGKLKGDA